MKVIRFVLIVVAAIAIGGILARFTWNSVEYHSFIPNIVVAAESLGPAWLTNTLLTTLVVDALILVPVLLVRRSIRQDGSTQTNIVTRVWESLIDRLYHHDVLPILGKRAKVVVPIAVTAFVFIFVSASLVLVPGVESIGQLKASSAGSKGWCAAQVGGVALVTGVPVDEHKGYAGSCGRAAPIVGTAGDAQHGYSLTPFLRRPTSDMNVALALALVAFFFVEIQGIRANGWHYFNRFFPVRALQMNHAGLMNGLGDGLQFIAGLFELIVEFVRILSFAFRLFGSMFIGTVLMLTIGVVMPVLLPTVFLGLEFAAGIVQAFVFLMLITAFTSLAVAHGDE